jgi:hypothetical protein
MTANQLIAIDSVCLMLAAVLQLGVTYRRSARLTLQMKAC